MRVRLTKMNIFGAIVILVLLIAGLILGANPLYCLALIANLLLLLYSYDRIENRSLLFTFGVAYFTFLLGREFLEVYFQYRIENYSANINNHTYLCLILGTLGVWITYAVFERRSNNRKIESKQNSIVLDDPLGIRVRKISKWLFFASMPFGLITRFAIAWFVRRASYTEYYIDFVNVLYGGNAVLYIVGRLENVMPVALGIFFSTLPSKRESKPVMLTYFLYCVISLGAGNRGTFVLGVLYLFVFIVHMQGKRPEEQWFEKKMMIYAIILIPIIAVAGSLYNLMRLNMETAGISLLDAFINFFYDQGVTITVIKHGYELEDMIPKQGPYLLEFLHSGTLARLLGIPVYHGNTVEHALYGGSFTHSLAYTVMMSGYLAGRGTGTSYIAELYYDLGYPGVFFGSAVYGWLFSKIQNSRANKLFVRSLIFVLVTQFLWAPRGSYSAFISFLSAPTTIASYILIWGLAKLIQSKYRNS